MGFGDLWGIGQAGHDFTTQWIKPGIDWYWSKKASARQMEQWKEMLNYQYSIYNKWNSPSAQMTRFADAKLNPNLIYGAVSGTYSTGGTPMPHVNAPEFDAGAGPDLGSILQNVSDLKSKKADRELKETIKQHYEEGIDKTKADTAKVKAETDRVKAETAKTAADTDLVRRKVAEADATGTTDTSTTGRLLGYISGLFRKASGNDAVFDDISTTQAGKDGYTPSHGVTRATRYNPDSTQGRQGLTNIGENVEGGYKVRTPNAQEIDNSAIKSDAEGMAQAREDMRARIKAQARKKQLEMEMKRRRINGRQWNDEGNRMQEWERNYLKSQLIGSDFQWWNP